MWKAFTLALGLALAVTAARAEPVTPDIVRDLAPTGRLRAAINTGNIVLAHRNGAGELSGVSVDLARELARRVGLELDLIPFDAAGKVADAGTENVWDVAFLAIDPVRASGVAFTSPYLLIEGTYAVPEGSALRSIADVDQEGVQIAVGRGSAYDLFLTRKIKRASLVRTTTSADAVWLFVENKLDVVAGVKQPLVLFARDTPGFRVMEGRFMAIEQAIGAPKGRDLANAYLRDFVEEMKASGFVAAALERHRQPDAVVAPPVGPPP